MKCNMCGDDRDDVYRIPPNPKKDENFLDICPDCHIYCFQAVGTPIKENSDGNRRD